MTRPEISKVTESLYLSSYVAIQEERLLNLGITHIINITEFKPNHVFPKLPDLEYLRVPIRDLEHSDILSHFEACAAKIRDVGDAGGRTLVHCVMGMSRSASVCIAYLVKEHKLSLADAYLYVKKCRPIIHPNIGFWKQLIEYEHRVRGEGNGSVHLVRIGETLVPNVLLDEDTALSKIIERQSMYI